jgi:hypothetical protein
MRKIFEVPSMPGRGKEYGFRIDNPDGSAVCIPLTLDNTDCVKFLNDWKSGEEVLHADGTPAIYSDEILTMLGLNP